MALPILALVAGAQALKGIVDKNNASAEADKLEASKPKYTIAPEAGDELSLAESEFQNGMSAKSERAYENLVGGDYANSLGAILKSGGNVNNIGALYGAREGGREKLALLEDDLRMKQLNNLILARRNKTEQKDKDFMYNQDQWWKNKAQAVGQERQAADKATWEGIGSFGSSMAGWSQNKEEMSFWDKYLNPPNTESNTKTSIDTTDTGGYNGSWSWAERIK